MFSGITFVRISVRIPKSFRLIGDKVVAGWARESILLDLLRLKEFRPSSNLTVSVVKRDGKP